MKAANPHVLVVGFGSVGRRHAQNLAKRGACISIVDVRTDRLSPPAGLAVEQAFRSIDDALAANLRFDGAVIATPTAFHLDDARTLIARGCHVLLEKPVAIDLKSAREIAAAEARSGRRVLLGYTWRWWPALRELRARVRSGAIGRPLRAEFVMASHLEDWHPGEPLAEFFMSRAALGGGALLDESHWVDQMLWLFGEPLEVAGHVERVSSLPIDSDDHVELQVFYPHGLRVRIHLDLYTRPTERTIAVYGDAGALKWTFEGNVLSEFRVADPVWRGTVLKNERNDMFDSLAAEFLAIMSSRETPSCVLSDGLRVMEIIELARTSSRAGGKRVALADLRNE